MIPVASYNSNSMITSVSKNPEHTITNNFIRPSYTKPSLDSDEVNLQKPDNADNYKLPNYTTKFVKVPFTKSFLFSAYLDDRPYFHGPAVYVLGYQTKQKWSDPLYGQITFFDGTKKCLGLSEVEMPCSYHCNRYIHYSKFETVNHIFKLRHFDSNNPPITIALGNQRSCLQLSPEIQIYVFKPQRKKKFGVCVQTPLYGKNIAKVTRSLIEFIELHRIFGVELFTVYDMVKSSYLQTVFQEYQADNILEVVPWNEKFQATYPLHYYGEILSIHDCLYRNMHRVEYLAFFDLDEAIVPQANSSWSDMMLSIKRPDVHAYVFSNKFYISINKQQECNNGIYRPIQLSRLHRAECSFTTRRAKVIVEPTRVNNLDIHAVPSFVNNGPSIVVPSSIGLLYHYRKKLTADCKNRTLTYDPYMLKYETVLLECLKKRKRFLQNC